MLFKPYHIPMIRSGSKTETRREWAENYAGPNVGTVVAAKTDLLKPDDECDCFIRIVGKREQRLGDMTDADARAEGDYEDLDEFRVAYREVYGDDAWGPEKVVTAVEFEYVGRNRPIEPWTQDIHQGDAVETLAEMPANSVHAAVTSPPYYGLRDYDAEGQIGLEDHLGEYIASIVEVGEELQRVVRDDGSWWLNLGDTFAGSNNGRSFDGEAKETDLPTDRPAPGSGGFPRKSKMLVPHRVAIALQDAGWIVRADAVWSKPNPTPNPVDDRLHEHKEYVFHLVQKPDYWFDLDAIREPPKEESIERAMREYDGSKQHDTERWPDRDTEGRLHSFDTPLHPNGKNPGDVLEIPVQAYPDAHFAVFPEELPEVPIKSSVPPEVCAECGAPYERQVEEVPVWERDKEQIRRPQLLRAIERFEDSHLDVEHLKAVRATGFSDAAAGKQQSGAGRNTDDVEQRAREAKEVLGGYFREFTMTAHETVGWEQGCDCDTDDAAPGVVLDPFAGAGTTCKVAKEQGRRFVGIDLNETYVAMAQRRVGLTVDEPELLLADDEVSLSAYADGGAESGN